MLCEKCGAKIDEVWINHFNFDGSDSFKKISFQQADENAIVMETDQYWTGYELTEEEQRETIICPKCNEFPFKHGEIQVYDVVRIVCFKSDN